jgi:hypothetical protein
MSDHLPLAYVSHTTLARVRFRVPSKRHDESYFETVKSGLADRPTVAGVRVTPRTGSVLVFHGGTVEAIAEEAEKAGLFRVTEEAIEETAEHHFAGMPQDLHRMLPPVLIALGIIQILRGQMAGPASTLLWMALSMMMASGRSGPRGDWPAA